MTVLALTLGGWAACALATAVAARVWHAAVLRGEAVARACHEVRGPLAAVRLGLESTATAASAGHLRAIELELARAALALDDLQGVPALTAGVPGPAVVDARSWLARSVQAWRPVAQAHGMKVRLDWAGPDVAVWGHESRLAQVTGNLIANAIDHGESFVEVRGRSDADRLVIEVLDGGPGLQAMPRALLPRRGAGWGRGVGHPRGHGLAIARAVTEEHGGILTTAPSDRGARLVVTLPVVEESVG